MTWRLDLDALERCPGGCGRLICDSPDCDVLRRLMDGTFYTHPRTDTIDEPDWVTTFTPDEWRAMAETARLRHVAEVADALQRAREAA